MKYAKYVVFSVGIVATGIACQQMEKADIGAQSAAVSSDSEIQAYIDKQYYAAYEIKYSFLDRTGRNIDCIDFYAQRSVKALLAKGESVTSALPPNIPRPAAPAPHKTAGAKAAWNGDLDKNGHARLCPAGTVAAKRPTISAIQAEGGLAAYKAKRRPRPTDTNQDANQHDCYHQSSNGPGWDHTAAYDATTFSGALTITPVYQPVVFDYALEHSLSQMWVENGGCESWQDPYGDTNTCLDADGGVSSDAAQTVEVGWIVGNDLKDEDNNLITEPWLFAFMTTDGYADESDNNTTPLNSCFANIHDTCCGGDPCWVSATSPAYTPGVSLLGAYVQPLGDAPDEMAIQIWNGSADGYDAWYVLIDGNVIGWYPASAFHGGMQTQATYLQVGGEIFDSWTYGSNQPTPTQMGTGYIYGPTTLGSPQYKWVAYQRNVNTISSSDTYSDASLSYVVTPSGEGDLSRPGVCGWEAGDEGQILTEGSSGTDWHSYFFFGDDVTYP